MNRLLMAAARGARVQTPIDVKTTCQCIHCGGTNKFGSEERITLDKDMLLAIHGDDTHLLYGPISTALRKHAERPPSIFGHFGDVERCYVFRYKDHYEYYSGTGDFHKSLFILLVAEAISYEGL